MSDPATDTLHVKPEFVIDRQGKKFALLVGLLDLAHRRYPGRFSIKTTLLKVDPTENWAVVQATVEIKDGTGQTIGVFEGMGDVTRANIGNQVKDHWLRMAESRSIARALRAALNVAEAVDEADQQRRQRPAAAPHEPPPPPQRAAPPAASRPQQEEILRLAKEHRGWSDTEAKAHIGEHYGHPGRLDLLTAQQAQEAIATLSHPRANGGTVA